MTAMSCSAWPRPMSRLTAARTAPEAASRTAAAQRSAIVSMARTFTTGVREAASGRRLQPQPVGVEQRLGIAVRLVAAFEDQVAGGLEGDRRIVIDGHGAIVRIAGILLVDDAGHA